MGGAIQGRVLNLLDSVSTLAGTETSAGYTDGTGAKARFNDLEGITTDGTNLYVADRVNSTIRKIVITTGVVTTLAGTAGSIGSTDDTGVAARFYGPIGITSDGTNLYVSDTENYTVRKIVISTGAVTTLAGTAGSAGSTDGTGSAARFSALTGITTDGTNLYVTDTSFHTIRKIVISTGEVTTLAGTAISPGSTDGTGSAARFYYPFGITTDGTNLFVVDTYNNTIRKIVISTGVVTTLAGMAGSPGSTDGTGAAVRFSYPLGTTTDGTKLYVVDSGNSTIRQIVISTGVVTTLAGTVGSPGSSNGTGTMASFHGPVGISTDGTNLFVDDSYNNTIRQIVISTGVVTTFAGTAGSPGSTDGTGAAARFSYPCGITTDGTNLYAVDNANSTIRKIVISTGVVTTLAGTSDSVGSTDGAGAAARFYYPCGITTDGTNLYVVDVDNDTIRQIVIATGVVSTLAGTPGSVGSTNGTGAAARFNLPLEITTDGTSLYVTDNANSTIRKIVISTGVVTTLAGTPGSVGSTNGTGASALFKNPNGITTDGINLYVADSGNYTIRRIVISTGVVTTLAGSPGSVGSTNGMGAAARFKFPSGITTDGFSLYVNDRGNNTIRKISISTGVVTTLAGTAGSVGSTDGTVATALFSNPTGITTDGKSLFVGDSNNNTVRQIH
ncbi:MAG: hypothetical protein HYR80_09930 [Nitrospirae bacterium]|nr:hypothetical protein [Nitrospirota bacterium]